MSIFVSFTEEGFDTFYHCLKLAIGGWWQLVNQVNLGFSIRCIPYLLGWQLNYIGMSLGITNNSWLDSKWKVSNLGAAELAWVIKSTKDGAASWAAAKGNKLFKESQENN